MIFLYISLFSIFSLSVILYSLKSFKKINYHFLIFNLAIVILNFIIHFQRDNLIIWGIISFALMVTLTLLNDHFGIKILLFIFCLIIFIPKSQIISTTCTPDAKDDCSCGEHETRTEVTGFFLTEIDHGEIVKPFEITKILSKRKSFIFEGIYLSIKFLNLFFVSLILFHRNLINCLVLSFLVFLKTFSYFFLVKYILIRNNPYFKNNIHWDFSFWNVFYVLLIAMPVLIFILSKKYPGQLKEQIA